MLQSPLNLPPALLKSPLSLCLSLSLTILSHPILSHPIPSYPFISYIVSCLCLCLCHLSIYRSIHQSIHSSIQSIYHYLSLSISIYLSIDPSIHSSIYQSINQSIYLSIYLSLGCHRIHLSDQTIHLCLAEVYNGGQRCMPVFGDVFIRPLGCPGPTKRKPNRRRNEPFIFFHM